MQIKAYFFNKLISNAHGSSKVAVSPPSETNFVVTPGINLICLRYRSKYGSNITTSSDGRNNDINDKYKACDAPTVIQTSLKPSMGRFKCSE